MGCLVATRSLKYPQAVNTAYFAMYISASAFKSALLSTYGSIDLNDR